MVQRVRASAPGPLAVRANVYGEPGALVVAPPKIRVGPTWLAVIGGSKLPAIGRDEASPNWKNWSLPSGTGLNLWFKVLTDPVAGAPAETSQYHLAPSLGGGPLVSGTNKPMSVTPSWFRSAATGCS